MLFVSQLQALRSEENEHLPHRVTKGLERLTNVKLSEQCPAHSKYNRNILCYYHGDCYYSTVKGERQEMSTYDLENGFEEA